MKIQLCKKCGKWKELTNNNLCINCDPTEIQNDTLVEEKKVFNRKTSGVDDLSVLFIHHLNRIREQNSTNNQTFPD